MPSAPTFTSKRAACQGHNGPCAKQRGASTVAYAVMLPLFLSLLFGAYYLWRAVALRQVLNRATYLATRQIARLDYHIFLGWDEARRNAYAQEAINDYLLHDGFIPRHFDYTLQAVVDVDPARDFPVERLGGPANYSILFAVRAELRVPLVRLPFGRRGLTISVQHLGTFTHEAYRLRGQRPSSDPEAQNWHVVPWSSGAP